MRSAANYLENIYPHPISDFIIHVENSTFCNDDNPLGYRDFKLGKEVFDPFSIRNLDLNFL